MLSIWIKISLIHTWTSLVITRYLRYVWSIKHYHRVRNANDFQIWDARQERLMYRCKCTYRLQSRPLLYLMER